MKVIPTALAGVKLIEPHIFGDDRGFVAQERAPQVRHHAREHFAGVEFLLADRPFKIQ